MSFGRVSVRSLIADLSAGPLVVPGVGSPLEARCAAAAGFSSVYLSGYATAAWRFGQPDIGLIALNEVADTVQAIAEAVDRPIICDADTGYGDLANVRRTVRTLERLGAGAIQLEDQAWPKRCGHLRGKTVIAAADHARKIAGAVAARQDPDTVIIARTDALAPYGMTEALERMKRCADAGADALFIDAPTSTDDLETIATTLAGHVLVVNMSESGMTPHLSATEFHQLGFGVVLFPTSALRLSTRIITEFYADLQRTGDSRSWTDRMVTLTELNTVVGLDDLEDWESRIAPTPR